MKSSNVIIRVSASTKSAWQSSAAACGMSLSEWIHMKCSGIAPTVVNDVPVYSRKIDLPFTDAKMKPEDVVMATVNPLRPHHPRCTCLMCKPEKISPRA